MTRAIADAAAAADAKMVMADNLYSYGAVPGGYGPESPSGPMTESTPSRATGPKGRVRARMAQDLLAMHRAGAVRVTIGRLGDYFGPGGTSSLVGADLFAGVLAGKAAIWPGPSGHLHSFSFLPDAARALVTLGTEDRADGQIWHLPHADAITPAAFIALVQDAAGARRRVRRIPAAALALVGLVNPMVKELGELRYQLDRPSSSTIPTSTGPSAAGRRPMPRPSPPPSPRSPAIPTQTPASPLWKAAGHDCCRY